MNSPTDKQDHSSTEALDAELDQLLAGLAREPHEAPAHLASRVLANLPTNNPFADLLDWFTASYWRSAWTAALPLVFGFALGMTVQFEGDSYIDDLDMQALLYVEQIEEIEFDEI
ncbi:MAG: hypothetical protein AAF993_21980 [Pseudomonadota bacterium]